MSVGASWLSGIYALAGSLIGGLTTYFVGLNQNRLTIKLAKDKQELDVRERKFEIYNSVLEEIVKNEPIYYSAKSMDYEQFDIRKFNNFIRPKLHGLHLTDDDVREKTNQLDQKIIELYEAIRMSKLIVDTVAEGIIYPDDLNEDEEEVRKDRICSEAAKLYHELIDLIRNHIIRGNS